MAYRQEGYPLPFWMTCREGTCLLLAAVVTRAWAVFPSRPLVQMLEAHQAPALIVPATADQKGCAVDCSCSHLS